MDNVRWLLFFLYEGRMGVDCDIPRAAIANLSTPKQSAKQGMMVACTAGTLEDLLKERDKISQSRARTVSTNTHLN